MIHLSEHLDNTRGQRSETHLHVYWLKGRKKKVVQHHHRWISFFIFFPLFYQWFFLSLTQQRCVCVAADCKSIRWSVYKRVKYWMKFCWILVHWYRFWKFNLIFFRGWVGGFSGFTLTSYYSILLPRNSQYNVMDSYYRFTLSTIIPTLSP